MEFGLDAFTLIATIISVLIGLSLHEMMHAVAGLKLGDTTAQEEGRISFNPLSHIDPFMTVALPIITLIVFQVPILAAKPVPFNPARVKWDEFGAAIIAAAGPLTNLALAILGAALIHVTAASGDLYDALRIFVGLNIGIFVFNLVPIPPLDGSRVLYAFAPDAVREFMAQIEKFGIFIVFGLILVVPGFSQILININDSIFSFLV